MKPHFQDETLVVVTSKTDFVTPSIELKFGSVCVFLIRSFHLAALHGKLKSLENVCCMVHDCHEPS